MINIGLAGSTGKMGYQIAKEIALDSSSYSLAQALVSKTSSVTAELQNTAREFISNVSEFSNIDVIIDFSNPNLTLDILPYAIKNRTPIVIGTTGFNSDELRAIDECAKTIPLLISPNMSLSVNLLFKLAYLAAAKLPNFEAEIIEAHHRYKKDAPSGTALKIGEMIAKARDIDFATHAKYTRFGTDLARQPQDIGFAVIRGGDVVGEHEVQFMANGEVLSLKSSLTNRSSFALGALSAANFLVQQEPGLYSMFDVLNLD
jgi:4-hydroxy-tetrahydrodipicolinate reductase